MKIDYHKIAAYLNGTADEQQRQEVEKWIAKSPQNLAEFQELSKIWQQAGHLRTNQLADPQQSWQRFSELRDRSTGTREISISWKSWTGKAAAGLLLLVTLSYVVWNVWQPGQQLMVTVLETRSNILLPDGSRVWLNRHSSLRYPRGFTSSERRIELTGEGYFEVAEDAAKPFVIKTGKTGVKVLGTSFNVRNAGEETEVAVLTGRVAFYGWQHAGDTLLLQPQDLGTYNSMVDRFNKTKNTDPNLLSWKTGRLVFENMILTEVVSALERHYQQKISLEGVESAHCRINTEFDNRSLDEVMEELALILGGSIAQIDQGYVLSTPGCQ